MKSNDLKSLGQRIEELRQYLRMVERLTERPYTAEVEAELARMEANLHIQYTRDIEAQRRCLDHEVLTQLELAVAHEATRKLSEWYLALEEDV